MRQETFATAHPTLIIQKILLLVGFSDCSKILYSKLEKIIQTVKNAKLKSDICKAISSLRTFD